MNVHFYEKNTVSKNTAKRLKSLITKPLNKFKAKIKDVNINIQYFDLQQPQLLKSLQVVITLNCGKEYYFVKNHASILEAINRMRNLIKTLISSKSSDQKGKINGLSLFG